MNKPKNVHISAIRNNALGIFQSGVSAADPFLAVKHCLIAEEGHLKIRSNSAGSALLRTGGWSKVHLIAFGKAACRMAKAARVAIPEFLWAGPGIAVTNYENAIPIPDVEVIGAGHPLPDEAGFRAAIRIAERARAAKKMN